MTFPHIDYDPDETPVPGMIRYCYNGYAGPGNYIYSPTLGCWFKVYEPTETKSGDREAP